MPMTDDPTNDPATAFLLDHLLPLCEAAPARYQFAGPDAETESYFGDCRPDADGDVRLLAEDVPAMLDKLFARWRAGGRDDLAGLEDGLREMVAVLLAQAEDSDEPHRTTASGLLTGRRAPAG